MATRSVQLPTASARATVAPASAAASRPSSNAGYWQQKQPPPISSTRTAAEDSASAVSTRVRPCSLVMTATQGYGNFAAAASK